MESKTKINLTQHQINTLIKKHFGSQTALVSNTPLKDGWFNTAYLLILNDGFETVLKIAPPPHIPILTYEKDIMRAEVDVMQQLAAAGKVTMPKFLAVDFTRTDLPSDYYLMEVLHGTTLDKFNGKLSKEDREWIERQKGQFAAHFHQVTNDEFGYPMMQGKPYTHSWREAFLHIITDILADRDLYKVRLPRKADAIYHIFEQNAHLLDAVTTPVLLHFDFWDGNIFIHGEPGNYQIEGVIDFERAIWGDPVAELAVNIGSSPDDLCKSAFMQGYQEISGRNLLESAEERQRFLMYKTYLELIMVIECAPRSYPLPLHTWIKTYVYQILRQNLKQLEENIL